MKQDAFKEDGYRIHVNPDGSSVYLEGHPSADKDPTDLLNDGTGAAIDKAVRRRGLNFFPIQVYAKENHHINKLGRIMQLEHALCGEEDW